MVSEAKSDPSLTPPWQRWLIRLLSVVVVLYLVWLGVMVGLRAKFPWDLFMWPESPYMTNMLKVELGQPIFTSPADGNSFVYSPGLEYLTFAILKPPLLPGRGVGNSLTWGALGAKQPEGERELAQAGVASLRELARRARGRAAHPRAKWSRPGA